MVERFKPRATIQINGVPRTLLAGSCTIGTRAAFITGTFPLDPLEGKPDPGDRVEVRGGFGGALLPLFTGEIDGNRSVLAPNEIVIACTGTLARLQGTIGEPPAIDDGYSEPEYVVSYESKTAKAIIGDLCDRYGVSPYALADSGKVFATLEPIGLVWSDNGWSLVQQLDEAEGYRTYQGPDGIVRRLPLLGIPGAVYRTFEQGVDLFAAEAAESRLGTFNRVIATGLPQQGTTGQDITPTGVLSARSPWIPSPPTYRAYSWGSFLFETGDDCEEYAARKLGELNRLRGELPFDLLIGDPALQPGMSVAIEALRLDVRTNVRFWITELTHNLDQGLNTSGVALLASAGTGWAANQAPIAVISYRAMRETLADGAEIVEVVFDGSASYDPELGIAGIASYVWTGSPTAPTPFDEGRFAALHFTGAIPDGATVTLTVTDDLGKTGSTTIQLATVARSVTIRDIISAEGTRLQVSRDGQRTWQNVTIAGSPIAAVGTCEFGAAEYTFAWTAGGDLIKVLDDDGASVVLSAGITACAITFLSADTSKPSGRVWAGSSDGRVWLSPDHGVTWFPKTAAPNGGQVTHIHESDFAFGDIEMAAGNVAYRSFDEAVAWIAQYTHPNINLVAARIAAGFGKGWIGFAGPGPDADDLGASRLRERTDTVALNFPSGARPASVVGLALDTAADLLYALDVDSGGSGRAWRGNSGIGGEMVAQTYDHATYGAPRHMIRDGTMPGLVYIAAANKLLKSIDGLATILVMKNLSGGATGRMIGYGALRSAAIEPYAIASEPGDELGLALWNGTSNNDPPAGWYAIEFDDSGWSPTIAAGSAGSPPVAPGSAGVWAERIAAPHAGEAALVRRHFDVVGGAIKAATLVVSVDNFAPAIYLNGQWVDGYGGLPAEPFTYDVTDLIRPGAANVLAIWGSDHPLGGVDFISFTLTINGGAA